MPRDKFSWKNEDILIQKHIVIITIDITIGNVRDSVQQNSIYSNQILVNGQLIASEHNLKLICP